MDRVTSPAVRDPQALRARLAEARLMLLLTPDACPGDPLALVESLAGEVDAIQVRPKPKGSSRAPAQARATLELARGVLDIVGTGEAAPLVLVDDRVDVAMTLWSEGVAGVHLGQDDMPPGEARRVLGPGPLIGLSTHDLGQVVLAGEEPVDYLGFGPVWATETKGYSQGLGPEVAWVASNASPGPLFPIGGIDGTNADELAEVGRAAVGSVLLCAEDPAGLARALRRTLSGDDQDPQGKSSIASP